SLLRMSYLYDHLSGGYFAMMPPEQKGEANFAKRLPDQIAAIQTLATAFQLHPSQEIALNLQQTIDFVERNLSHPDGGYITALYAESQGEKGRFYLWSDIDVEHVLKDQARFFARYYAISHEGNWLKGLNLPHQPLSLKAVAAGFRIPEVELAGIMDQTREKMLAERRRRAAPKRDEKIIISWNAKMVLALLRAGRALEDKLLLERARETLTWLFARAFNEEDQLFRYRYEGQGYGQGMLEDYAYLSQACLQWYIQSLDERWLQRGIQLLRSALPLFFEAESNLFQDHIDGKGWGSPALHTYLQGQGQAVLISSLRLASRLQHLPTFRQIAADQIARVKAAALRHPLEYAPWAIEGRNWVAPRPLVQVAPDHHETLLAFLHDYHVLHPLVISAELPLPESTFGGPVWAAGSPNESGDFPDLVPLIQDFDW
ncbi:MAG: hypothetical protein AAFV07_08960, partial [Bacteroidota bacterium]